MTRSRSPLSGITCGIVLFVIFPLALEAQFSETRFFETIELYKEQHALVPASDGELYNYPAVSLPTPYIVPLYSRTQPSAVSDMSLVVIDDQQPQLDGAPTLAVELAGFIMDRATHEVLSRIFTAIENGLGPTLYHSLLPNTVRFLPEISSMEPRTIVSAFRSAAASDLQELPSTLIAVSWDPSSPMHLHIESLRLVHETLELVRAGITPRMALPNLAEVDGSTCDASLFRFLGIVAAELRYADSPIDITIDKATYELSLQNILDIELLNDVAPEPVIGVIRDLRKLYWKRLLSHAFPEAILHGQDDNRDVCQTCAPTVDLSEHRSDAATQVEELVESLSRALRQAELLIARSHEDGLAAVDLLRPTIEIIKLIDTVGDIFCEKGTMCDYRCADDGRDGVVNSLRIPHHYVDMYLAAVEQRYTDVVAKALLMFGLSDMAYDSDSGRSGADEFAKLILLAGNLSETSHPNEFRDILDAFVEPVGSFARKREGGFYITIGSYVGARVGLEHLTEVRSGKEGSDNRQRERELHVGVALPIGVEIGWGLGDGTCCSLGAFIAPVDLGIVADYRLSALTNNRAVKVDSSRIYWTNLLAPSVYVVFGFPWDWPSALAIGGQYAPGLRLEDGAFFDAWRLSLMIGVDVTLFTF